MNSILKWTEEFRKETQKQGEIVAFDILGGDFNLDNMSPGQLYAAIYIYIYIYIYEYIYIYIYMCVCVSEYIYI